MPLFSSPALFPLFHPCHFSANYQSCLPCAVYSMFALQSIWRNLFFCLLCLGVLGIKPRAWHWLGKHSVTELHHQPRESYSAKNPE